MRIARVAESCHPMQQAEATAQQCCSHLHTSDSTHSQLLVSENPPAALSADGVSLCLPGKARRSTQSESKFSRLYTVRI